MQARGGGGASVQTLPRAILVGLPFIGSKLSDEHSKICVLQLFPLIHGLRRVTLRFEKYFSSGDLHSDLPVLSRLDVSHVRPRNKGAEYGFSSADPKMWSRRAAFRHVWREATSGLKPLRHRAPVPCQERMKQIVHQTNGLSRFGYVSCN